MPGRDFKISHGLSRLDSSPNNLLTLNGLKAVYLFVKAKRNIGT